MTDFDGIPLFGQLVNGVARSQHEQRQPELSREVKEKVAAQAKERIDAEAGERLGRVASQLQEKVFAPMDMLCLNPTLIAGQTTEERVIARLRLAGRDQLGSCAAAAGSRRQPGQRANRSVGDQQRGRAVGPGRPVVHAARTLPPLRPMPLPPGADARPIRTTTTS